MADTLKQQYEKVKREYQRNKLILKLAKGKGKNFKTLREICEILDNLGYHNKKGGQLAPETIRYLLSTMGYSRNVKGGVQND